MNKVYRLIWSSSHNAWVVTSEITKSRGKRSCKALLKLMPLGALLPVFALAQPPPVDALPTGGQVVAGQASMAQSGNTLNINQGSQRAAIDWQGFNIGSQATVNFQQPSSSSVALNRVVGGDASQIMGNLNANGQVFITNPNGVIFGRTASVNVGGLVATTHSISNEDFMAGDDRFTRDDATGSVINEGQLSADLNGYIALLAPEVRNEGVIVANMGTVALAAGEAFTLQLDGGRLAGIQVEPATIKALVENKHAVQAAGGLIILSARAVDSLQGSVVNNSGVLQASSLTERGGVIRLEGDHITLDAGSELIATGATGGGQVLVGGDWQGSGDMHQATTVTMEAGAKIDVSATQNGDGGTAVLWSDVRKAGSVTNAHGTLLAKGGVTGGDGGRIETSGHLLNVDGVSGSAAAAHGKAGEWLFDPTNVDINNSGGASSANDGTSALSASSIAGLLNGGTSVTVTTFSGSGDLGELTVNSAINKSSGNSDVTLTLRAANSVVVNQNITHTGGSGKLNLVLDADNNTGSGTSSASPSRDGAGIVILEANLSTGGGSLTVGGTASGGFTGGDLYVGGGGNAISITTAGGAVDVKGQLIIANSSASGLSVNTAGGNITLGGSVDSGNSYAAISGARTWLQAVDDADNVANSWLATVTSRLENALASRAAGYSDSWLGGRRVTGIGTDSQWRWVTGPEASQDAGRGLVFFNQNANGGGGSPVGTNYAPTPFSSGEPNNWTGSAAGALSSEFESVLQFTGSQGKWNDLPGGPISQNNTQRTVGQYVRETNLAPSKLTLNAGAGNVTISGGVGSNKALSSFAVTAGSTLVNGNALITTGAQTYSGGLTAQSTTSLQVTATTLTAGGPLVLKATASDVLLNATIVNNAASATSLTVEAGRHIRLGDTASISASTAAMNTQLWADTDSSGDGIVYVESAGITTRGGSLTFGKSGQTASIGGQTVRVGGDVFFQRGSAQTLSTGGGALNVYGETIVANTAGLNVTSGNGNVTFHGLLNSGNQYTFVDKTGSAGSGTWNDARTEAKNGTGGGSGTGQSYLVNITSRLENSIAGLAAGYKGAWIGAYRPDISSYNWAWADGPEAGQTFFVQTGSGGSGGGNAQAGFYANFGEGEPNGNQAPNGYIESVGQFFGAAGQWNDLTNTENYRNDSSGGYAVNGFVRETNLAASPVTINAGTGAVSIVGGVGASKALASLNVTSSSTTVNGNGMVTTGAQTYSSGLTVNAGSNNLNLGGTGITTGGAVSFSGGSITTLSNGLALNTGANNVAIITNAVTNNGNKITLNATGALTYAPLGTNWTNVGGALNFDGSTTSGNFSGGGDVGWLGINNVGNLSGLTLGKVGNTSGISIDTAVSVAGPIALYGDNITINAGLQATNNSTITLQGTGNVIDGLSGFVDALNLRLQGGNVTLDNISNAVGYLAASGVGDLTYLDSNTLVINTIGGTAGISATGIVNIGTLAGDLSLADDVSTTNTSTTALTLNADINASAGTSTGGNLFIQNNSTVNVGAGGRARLFSGSVADSGLSSLVGNGSNRFRYNSDETASNYTTALGSGLYAIYREQPSAEVVVDNQTITYGDALTLTGATSGLVNGDAGVYAITSALYSTSNNIRASASPYAVTQTNLTGLGYNLITNTAGTLTVNTKALTLSGFAADATKVYDGTKTATISNNGNLSGLVVGDVVTAANTGATYDNKNVGTGKTVTLNDVSITSTDAANYTIANTAITTANITAAPLTVTATTVSKTYDGNTNVTEKGQVAALAGAGAGEVVNSSGTQAFIDKNVGTNKTVQATGITIKDSSNADVTANYAITYIANAISTINRLNSVTWIGGATGNWFDPANWADGAVPDLSNVANVVIPNGVTVTFDTTGASGLADVSGPVNIDQLGGNAGSLVQANGELKVGTGGILLKSLGQTGGTLTNAGTTVVDSFSQSGGSFSGTGNMTAKQFNQTAGVTGLTGGLSVTQNFSQGETGSVTVGASTQIIDTSGGVQLGNLTSAGALTVNSTGGAITQATGTTLIASVAGTFSANNSGTAANIILANASNNFGGLLTASGADITLNDTDALLLGAVVSTGDFTANSNGNLTIGSSTVGGNLSAGTGTANGNISQAGALSITGSSTLNSGTGNTTLTNTANDFVGSVSVTGQDINLVDANGMSVALTAMGNSTLAAGGDLAVSGTTQNLSTTTTGTGTTSFDATTVAGDLVTTSAGVVSQTGALAVTGTADFIVTGQNVTLSNAANNFVGVVSATANNLSLADLNGITLGAVTTTGTLGVAAVGDITQTEGTRIAATGGTTLASTGGSIVLGNATNDFSTVNASGTQVSLVDTNGMSVALAATGNSTLTAGGDLAASGTTQKLTTTTTGTGTTSFDATTVAGDLVTTSAGVVSQTGALAVTGTADFIAADQNVTLSNAANNFVGVVSATANNLSLADLNGITLGTVTTTGTLGVAAVGDITQAAGTTIAATGATTLASTGGSITLTNVTNDFSTVNASGTQVSLVDTNGMSVALTTAGNSSLAAGGNLAVSGTTQNLSTTTTGTGATSFGATTVAGNLAANSAGAVSQTGVLAVTGTAGFMAAGQDVTLNNTANNFKAVVNVSGANVTLNDMDDLVLGSVTATGKLDATAGAIDLIDAVNADTLALKATTAAVSQTGGTLVVTGQSDLQAATNITLDQANNFNGAVNASGANVTLNDTDALVLAGVIARGNLIVTTGAGNLAGGVTQTGAIVVDGTTQFIANTKIDQEAVLTQANDFKGAVSFTGVNAGSWKNLTINDSNTLTLGDVMAGGLLNATATAIDLNGTVDADTLALKATNGAISQTGGALVVTGQSDLRATTDITLNQANDFNDLVNASGANITLNDTDDLVLGSVTTSGNLTVSSNADLNLGTSTVGGALTANSGSGGGNIIQTGPLSVVGESTLNAGAGNINLSNPTNSLGGVFNASANNVTVADNDGALTLGTVNAAGKLDATAGAIDLIGAVNAGSLDLKATIGAISQTGGTLTVAGQSDLQAATDITLDKANDFNGVVNAGGANVSLNDTDDLVLAGVRAGGNLIVTTGAGNLAGGVTQTGAIVVDGTTQFIAKTKIDQEVVLTLANDFKGAVSFTGVNAGSWKNLTINDTSTLTLGDVMSGGLLNATATAIDLNGTVDADTLALKATNGAISQTGGALVVTGQSDLRATTDITLNQANDFNDLVNASGANITLNDTDDLVLGSVTTSGNLTVSSNGDLNLGTSTVGGALTANSGSGGGNIIQTGPLSVVGDSTLNAGAGNIDLSNTANSLGGVFNASANNMTVADNDGALTLGAVNAAGKLDATAGAIDLIGAVNAGSLDLKATIGAISQTGGTLTVAGQSDLQAATDITLNQANDFVGRVNAQGRNVSLADINDLNLGGITTTGNLQTNNYGALNLGTSSVAGNLLVNSNGGNITASGPLMVAGSTGLYAGSGVIELDNPKNSFGGSVIAQGALVVLASSDSLPSTPPAPVIPAVALPFAAAPLVQTTQSMPQALSDTNVSAVQMFVLQEPSVEQSGVITVLVPREVILLKSSFRFTLPTTIYDVQRKVVDANVTLLDGQPLPAWLRFNAKTGVFSADAIPENAMPLQVRLTVDGQDTVVEISLQEE